MTIRAKIVGGLTFAALLSLIFAITGWTFSRMFTDKSNELYGIQQVGAEVSTVLNAHYEWRQALTQAVFTGSAFTGSLDPANCALGKWKNSGSINNITDGEVLALLGQLDESHNYIHNSAKEIVSMIESGQKQQAQTVLMENVIPHTETVISLLGQIEVRFDTLLEQYNGEMIAMGMRMTTIISTLVGIVLVTTLIMNWRITESILRPIRQITAAAEQIATGDVNVEVDYKVNDQIGSLVRSFQGLINETKNQAMAAEALANGDLTVSIKSRSDKDMMGLALAKMVDSLNDMFHEIQSSAVHVAAASKQIELGASSLAQGSMEQSAAIEELSDTVSGVADKTKRNTDIAREAAALSDTIKSGAEKGSAQMEQMMTAVREINDASSQIGKVIKVIDDIAFQTNILALNAAVEAARAGQHGKGFAVVAEEVRNLASKSAEAAKDTNGLIENSIAKANHGLNMATETSNSLREIVDGINRSAGIVAQIAGLSEEQAGAITQINNGIDQVSQVIQKNSATAEESASACAEMSTQSDNLEQLIARFKLKENALKASVASYGRKSLNTSANTSALNAAADSFDNSGDFGKY